jgi:plasmid stabilization system protein ParE
VVKSVGYKIVWDRQALDNLKEILGYLEKQSKQAPKIIKTSILEKLEHIKTNPLTFEVDKLTTYNSMQAIAAGSVLIWKFVFLL